MNKKKFLAFGIGIRRSRKNKTLDVSFPCIQFNKNLNDAEFFSQQLNYQKSENGFAELTLDHIKNIQKKSPSLNPALTKILKMISEFEKKQNEYHVTDFIIYFLFEKNSAIKTVEEAYFKLQCLSQHHVKPNGIGLEGLFATLNNIAWTSQGPVLPEDIDEVWFKTMLRGEQLLITHVDKFPYLLGYHVPRNARLASGSQVRLGAYIGEGTTVMPAGYVNFNAGTAGQAMIEGRVSAGVFVGHNTDIGGGASIMGALSGGNKDVITIGDKCLMGANSGTGISLGFGCTVAAGVYITAGTKVSLYNKKEEPVDLFGKKVKEGKNIVKAKELSGKDKLLFYHDSVSGKTICKPNPKTIELNPELHARQ